MQWASALSTASDPDRALSQALASLEAQLSGTPPDLVFAFASGSDAADVGDLPSALRRIWPGVTVFGGSAGGVLAEGREVEGATGLCLTAAVLPGVELRTFHLHDASGEGWTPAAARDRLQLADDPHFVLLPDPFTFDPQPLLGALDRAFPGQTKIGALASGATRSGQIVLLADESIHREGMVGLALAGNVDLRAVVCQGCRAIGSPMFVTRCQGNVITELDGRHPAAAIRAVWEQSPEQDRSLLTSALFLGIAMTPGEQTYRHGDFLIRQVVGFDAERGALAIAGTVEPNTVVQFHVRDAETSAADVELLLGRSVTERSHAPSGVLLLSCLGRGQGLYGTPDHDSRAFGRIVGSVPLGGFFGNGEIGPVRGATHLHGYTSVFGMFSPLSSH